MSTFLDRLRALFRPEQDTSAVLSHLRRGEAAAVTVRVDDSPGWEARTPRSWRGDAPTGPADRPWSERLDDLDDALEAWRKNFMIRRVVTMITSYVVGDGIIVSSRLPQVDAFVRAFWTHPKNDMAARLAPMCDELTRAGELFPVLHTNRIDGMSYVRFVPASLIAEIETAPNDYESERRYGQRQENSTELKWWIGPGHRLAYRPTSAGRLRPLMLHYAVNRPIGATRGEGDLGPVLPWAMRYKAWLEDRVRLNRLRTRQGIMDVEIADDSVVEQKRRQLRTSNPTEAGIYVHGPGEKVTMHELKIGAGDAYDDGQTLRMAIATGVNAALHYLGEGETVNYATAKEMGEPTARFFSQRQAAFCAILRDLVATAYRRAAALGQATMPSDGDLQLIVTTTEVARADNLTLAQAARYVTVALQAWKAEGWIDDATAARMAFRFAGEVLGEDEVAAMQQS